MTRQRFGTSRCQCGALVEWEIPTGEWYRGGSYKRFYDQGTHTQHICHAPAEAIAFDWARRWHIDYVPEGVEVPARPRPYDRAEAASSFTSPSLPRPVEPPPTKSLWDTVSE